MTARPLAGRRILITRPADRAAAALAMLGALGARVEARSPIDFRQPRDTAPRRRALAELSDYDWLVFTSANGVRFFLSASEAAGISLPPRGRIAAIGRATAARLSGAGLAVDLQAGVERSEGLAEDLVRLAVEGARILLVRPERARDVLPAALREAGCRVEPVPFYRTVDSRDAPAIARRVTAGAYHAVVFTSPSTLEALLAHGATLDNVRRVAIGPVTGAALEARNLAAHAVAATPTDRALTRAVGEVFDLRAPGSDVLPSSSFPPGSPDGGRS